MSVNMLDIMFRFTSLLVFLSSALFSYAQYAWSWTELDTMPFRTSNNAVCEATVNGQEYVYSFGGIDGTKTSNGIHQRSFAYDVSGNAWTEVSPLPDSLGKIAMGASFVNEKIYIIGGYHVLANGAEVSSNRVHIFNPLSQNFEADGASVPLAIDDHVQCVYKDSLIFVVTGWSNSANVTNVQIYNPALNEWTNGTPVPNTSFFKSFGASGTIVGDTIYYYGVQPFTARRYLRKGYIDPTDPTTITWLYDGESPGDASYRAACSSAGASVFWVGGASIAYNFDGLAYTNSAGVEPSARILHYTISEQQYYDEVAEPFGIMDLRGIAKLTNGRWIIAGGMDSNQVVSNRTFLLVNSVLGATSHAAFSGIVVRDFDSFIQISLPEVVECSLTDLKGKHFGKWQNEKNIVLLKHDFVSGIYLFVSEFGVLRIPIL